MTAAAWNRGRRCRGRLVEGFHSGPAGRIFLGSSSPPPGTRPSSTAEGWINNSSSRSTFLPGNSGGSGAVSGVGDTTISSSTPVLGSGKILSERSDPTTRRSRGTGVVISRGAAHNVVRNNQMTLNYYGYYYAYGASVSGRVDVDWGNFWVRGLVSGHVWDSWEGLDRFEADLTNNVSAFDSRTRFLLKAGWRLPFVPVRAFLAVEGIHRWGRIGDVRDGSQETRTFAGLSYLF